MDRATTDDFAQAPEGWREASACANLTQPSFFPALDDRRAVLAAKVVCAGCDVAEECLDYAVVTGQPDGIWGGLTPKERIAHRRRFLKELREAS